MQHIHADETIVLQSEQAKLPPAPSLAAQEMFLQEPVEQDTIEPSEALKNWSKLLHARSQVQA